MDAAHPELLRQLRDLLAAGRFREVLDRHRTAAAEPAPEAGLVAATAATRLGELDQADALSRDALARFRSRVDEDGVMRVLNLLGAIAFERGELELARQRFGGALAAARALGDQLMIGRTLNNLASVVHLRGDPGEALSRYREALLAYQLLGDRRGAAETCHNLGLVHRESGTLSEAERDAEQAVRHATLTGDPGLLGLALTGRAEVAMARGDLAFSAEALDRAAGLAARAEDALGQAEITRVQARLALLEDDPDRALRVAADTRDRALALGTRLLQAESAAVAAEAANRLGRTEEASGYRSEARLLFSALGATAHLTRLDQSA